VADDPDEPESGVEPAGAGVGDDDEPPEAGGELSVTGVGTTVGIWPAAGVPVAALSPLDGVCC
jgi:hypothetical protein